MCCGEKWHHGHKCSPTLQLHVLQEVWDLCEDLFTEESLTEYDDTTTKEHSFMLLSVAAVSQSFHPRMLQFEGQIQGHSINILLDPGSTNSFMDANFAGKLSRVTPLSSPTTVRRLMAVQFPALTTFSMLCGLSKDAHFIPPSSLFPLAHMI
jgi:hypothetical protein